MRRQHQRLAAAHDEWTEGPSHPPIDGDITVGNYYIEATPQGMAGAESLAAGLDTYTTATPQGMAAAVGLADGLDTCNDMGMDGCTTTARLTDRLASIDMSTAYTACVDEPVYM